MSVNAAHPVASRRFHDALRRLDALHAEDPTRERDGERELPAELLYAERMTAMLSRIAPDASEALRLAARAQHLARFRVPRSSQPDGRAGYLKWRTEQQRAHAALAREVLAASGYDDELQGRVESLVMKKRLAADPEAQLLEDCACLVFLGWYLEPFAAKESEADVLEILRKSWKKMGEVGRAEAQRLTLGATSSRLVRMALRPGSP